jgi:hypothetical protein
LSEIGNSAAAGDKGGRFGRDAKLRAKRRIFLLDFRGPLMGNGGSNLRAIRAVVNDEAGNHGGEHTEKKAKQRPSYRLTVQWKTLHSLRSPFAIRK